MPKSKPSARLAEFAKFGHVRILGISEIKLSPENDELYRPIDPTDTAILELADSIRTLGFKGSIIITKDGFILSGHRLHVAAGLAGLSEIPVTVENMQRVLQSGCFNPTFIKRLEMYNRQRVKTRLAHSRLPFFEGTNCGHWAFRPDY